MSIKGGFFESKLLAGVYDRSYSAGEYAERWDRFVSNGISIIDGGLLATENEVSIVTDTMTTQVEIGGGYINGYVYEVDAPEIVTHAAADPTNPRIDRVVIELNLEEATRAFVVKAVTGTPAASPAAPALTRTAEIWQISLAQVLVPANVVVLNTGTVTDERSDETLCGVANVKLGITPPSGDAEVLKNTITRLIETDTGAADAYVVDTIGTFEVVQGNQLSFIAANSNTGASTVTIDGQLLTIKDVDDAGLKIDPEAERIKAGQLVRGYIDAGFFVLASSAGGLGDFFGDGSDGVLNTAGNVTLTSTLNGPAVVKQYESITINAGHTLTVSQPCQGLVLYSKGDVVINGTIEMSKLAGLAPNANIIPQIMTNFKKTDPVGIAFYNQLTSVLRKLIGGAGGNGGYGGGFSGSTGRQSSVGQGGQGRQNLGGFGGGGSGGNSQGAAYIGGIGGSIAAAELGGGETFTYSMNGAMNLPGTHASCGGGAKGGIRSTGANYTWYKGGKCNGGGGGGTGANNDINAATTATDGEYAGGFILIIAKGNISIGATGVIRANGGRGGDGGNGVGTNAGGGGGGGGAGGGVIALFHKGSYSSAGTLAVSAGLFGLAGAASGGTAEGGGAGTSGSVGTIHVQQL